MKAQKEILLGVVLEKMQHLGKLGGGGFGSNTTTSKIDGLNGTSYGGGIGGPHDRKGRKWTEGY